MGKIFFKITGINRSICVFQHTLAFFGALIPLTIVNSAISPLTKSLSSHLPSHPSTLILPALDSAHKETLSLLETIDVLTFIEVSILPLSDSSPIRKA
jgi:hypothetical protein